MSDSAQADPAANLDTRIMRSSGWVALIYGSRTGLSVLSTLALVRLLEPKAFGLVALALTLVTVAEHVQAAGMNAALIYRRADVRRAAGSALVFSGCGAVVLYGVAFAAAPLFARAVAVPDVTDVVRVIAVVLILRGLGVVPGAILERDLDYRARAKGEVAAVATQVGVAVGLAAAGFGVWSLVAGHLAGAAVQSAAFWVLVPWRPSPRDASLRVLREMIGYGRFITAGNLIGLFNSNVQNAVIGRLLGATALGFYAVTFRVADLPTSFIGFVVGRMMFPAYAMVQDNVPEFRRAFLQALQRTALLAVPLAILLTVAAEPIVLGLLGPSWEPVVTPLRIVAVYSLVRSFAGTAGAVFQAAGKPHLVPLFALPQALTIVPALVLLTPRLGVSGAALAMLACFSLSGLPALAAAFRILGLGLGDAARALGPLVLCSAIGAAATVAILPASDSLPALAALALMLAAGTVTYVAGVVTLGRGTVAPMWASLRGQPG